MNPRNPADARLMLTALAQEIRTLMMHLEPHHRHTSGRAETGRLRQRLHLLVEHRRRFEQQLRDMLTAGATATTGTLTP